jgi:hypothetical protein
VAPGQLRNLLVWDFTAAGGNAATDGNAASVGSTTTAYGIQPGTIIRGTGSPAAALQTAQGRGAMNMNSSTSWTATTLSAAKTAGSYFQFAVAPFSGNQFSLSSIAFVTYQQNSHAAATVVLEYSINGFATAGVAVATNNPISYDGYVSDLGLWFRTLRGQGPWPGCRQQPGRGRGRHRDVSSSGTDV